MATSALKEKRFYKFGPFSLDAGVKVLIRDGQPVHLTLKAVDTLLALLVNPGQVVTKEEIMSAVWPDRVVDEANLAQNIAVIRKVLAAERGSPASIETFAGRGYRIVGPVTVETNVPPAHTEPAPPPPPVVVAPQPQLSAASRYLLPIVIAIPVLLSAVVVLLFIRPEPTPQETHFHIQPMTRLPGKESQPAVSPDGTRLAFLWTQEGARPAGIWTLAVGETSPHRASGAEGHFSSPAWSPDGRSLAFLRIGTSSTEVLTVSAATGEERRIASLSPPNYGPSSRLLDWSPDGTSLVVSHADAPGQVFGLFLISLQSGQRSRLTQATGTVGGDVDPRFSPDGKTISFIRLIHRSNQELFSVPVTGGGPRQLTTDGKQISAHDWMPDGRTIVFASDRGGEFRLWKLSAGGKPQSVGIYGEHPIELSLARKAQSLMYTVIQQDRNIWRLDIKDKKWTRVVASSGQDASPQYSPSGETICFRSDRSGEDQLWVAAADGSNPIQITRGSLYPSVGRWAPDGRSIVFNNARSGEIYLALREPDGTWTTKKIEGFGYHPVFSPDGTWIYAGTQKELVKIPASGGAAQQVAKTPGFSLGLSADGKFLYFMREPNETTLWRASTETGEVTRALQGLVPDCTSCWALSSTGIYYLGSSSQSFDRQMLFFHDTATGKDRQVIEYPEPLSPVGSGPFSLSPDMRHLLTVRVDHFGSDVMRVEPFR